MQCPATDRLNSFRNNEANLFNEEYSKNDDDRDINDNKRMDDEKRSSLTAKLARISEIDPDDEYDDKKYDKEDKNIDDDAKISYAPLKNLKENIDKMLKSWQNENEDSKAGDSSFLIDYEPILHYPRQSLATLSLSNLESCPDIDEDESVCDTYDLDSSNVVYMPLFNEDTYSYEYVPVYSNEFSQGKKNKRNNYDVTTYHQRPSKHYPSDFNTKTLQKGNKTTLEYFSIDEEKDPVSALYIWCSRNKAIPVFTFTSEMEARGKSVLSITFICKITLLGSSTVGRGTNKKEAKKVAAEKMLHVINSGFKDDAVEKMSYGLSRLELSKNPHLNTVIIKAEEDDAKAASNPISYLQEICLKQKWTVPDYRSEAFGSLFKCSVRLFIQSEILQEQGFGHTKKEAKINAARNIIAVCQREGLISKFH